jgi:hypothetical protein
LPEEYWIRQITDRAIMPRGSMTWFQVAQDRASSRSSWATIGNHPNLVHNDRSVENRRTTHTTAIPKRLQAHREEGNGSQRAEIESIKPAHCFERIQLALRAVVLRFTRALAV